MNAEQLFLSDLIVVDPNYDEYLALAIALQAQEVQVRFFSTGGDALRVVGACAAALWIINIRLPDISGVGLLNLMRHRMRHCRVILVGNRYSVGDELGARSAGATAYLCKPVSLAWREVCQTLCRSPAIRAGPEPFL